MLKWFVAFLLAIVLIGGVTPLVRRVGLGRLPGDLHFTRAGKQYSFPFASSLLLSALVAWLVYLFR